MKLSAPIFRLKRRARLLARAEHISLAQALDRVAQDDGFASWSLLAARHAKRDAAETIFARLAAGDLVLIGARPLEGKTQLALQILSAACAAGRAGAFFSLECNDAETAEIVCTHGLDPSRILIDTSDAISADHMIAQLGAMAAGGVIVVDYLQALDHQRAKPPLAAQLSALHDFARRRGLIFLFISQIDRRFDAAAKTSPTLADLRLPNRIDTALFSKTCFLSGGEIAFSDV